MRVAAVLAAWVALALVGEAYAPSTPVGRRSVRAGSAAEHSGVEHHAPADRGARDAAAAGRAGGAGAPRLAAERARPGPRRAAGAADRRRFRGGCSRLVHCRVATRDTCAMMIETGCVTVNGEPESNPNCKVDIKTVRFAAPLPRSRTALSARLESRFSHTHTHTGPHCRQMVGVETVLDCKTRFRCRGRREQSGPSTALRRRERRARSADRRRLRTEERRRRTSVRRRASKGLCGHRPGPPSGSAALVL